MEKVHFWFVLVIFIALSFAKKLCFLITFEFTTLMSSTLNPFTFVLLKDLSRMIKKEFFFSIFVKEQMCLAVEE